MGTLYSRAGGVRSVQESGQRHGQTLSNTVIQSPSSTRLFHGFEANVWLQQHLHQPYRVQWFDIGLVGVYLSFFVFPHILAIVFARLDIRLFRSYIIGLLATWYIGLLGYFLVPTAPPWMTSVIGLHAADRPHRSAGDRSLQQRHLSARLYRDRAERRRSHAVTAHWLSPPSWLWHCGVAGGSRA